MEQNTLTTLPKRVNYGKRNKNKGSSAERLYAKRFRDAGFEKCRTSREGSRLYDSCAVDLMFLPILVQVKAGKQKALNISQVLKEISERVEKTFPADAPEQTMPKIVIHHKDVGQGRQRTQYSELVTMTFEEFLPFLKAYYENRNKRND